MPAAPSSSIGPVLGQVVGLAEACAASPGDLRSVLSQVSDPRVRRGVRHRLAALLTLAACATLAGARSYTAVAEWAGDTDPDTRAALGLAGAVPSESTFHRVLAGARRRRLRRLLEAWAERRTRPEAGRRQHLTVDGKTLRGLGAADTPPRHLLAAFDHDYGVVPAQVDVAAKTGEASRLPALLDSVDLADVVITADAAHGQRATAGFLHARGAHYVRTVKRNQPTLSAQLTALPWTQVPAGDRTCDRGHGQVETRTVKVVAVRAGVLFPHAAQAVQVARRRDLSGRWRAETAYTVTSLAAHQAGAADLDDAVRGHWHVENRLHWVRDVGFDEDRAQIRTGNGPQSMASLRNLAIIALRLTGTTTVAAALHHHARRPNRPRHTLITC